MLTINSNRIHFHRGFTLLEMIVILVVTCVLMTVVIVPALIRAREVAKNNQCQDQLRQIGIHFYSYADNNKFSLFNSGAHDYLRDGDLTDFGWVADISEMQSVDLKRLRCPSNEAIANEGFLDFLGDNGQIISSRIGNWANQRYQKNSAFEIDLDGDGKVDQGTIPAGASERSKLLNKLLDRNLTTNYVPSWYLVRSDVRSVQSENYIETGNHVTHPKWELTDLPATSGPLRRDAIVQSSVPMSMIPLLADGAVSTRLNNNKGLFEAGTAFVSTMLRGPSQYDTKSKKIVSIPKGTDYYLEDGSSILARKDSEGPIHAGWIRYEMVPHGPWLQDTRGWAPYHPIQNGKLSLQVLMADGSVKIFIDKNQDDFLDPGIIASGNSIELPSIEICSSGSLPYTGRNHLHFEF